jgi:predicted MPP superfamily phosphohydrolase
MDCEAMRLGGDSIFFHQAAKIRLSVEVSHKMQVQRISSHTVLEHMLLVQLSQKKIFQLTDLHYCRAYKNNRDIRFLSNT